MKHSEIMDLAQGSGEEILVDYISLAMAHGHTKSQIKANLWKSCRLLAPSVSETVIPTIIEEYETGYAVKPKKAEKVRRARADGRYVVIDGESIGLHALADKTGIPYSTLLLRHNAGITDSRILEQRKKGRPAK